MSAFWMVLEVVGLFFLRIGVPLLVLIALGMVLDRWQSRRAETWRQAASRPPHNDQPRQAATRPPNLHHANDHSRP